MGGKRASHFYFPTPLKLARLSLISRHLYSVIDKTTEFIAADNFTRDSKFSPCINNRSSIFAKCTESLPFESSRYCGNIMGALQLRGTQPQGLTQGEYLGRCLRNIPQCLSQCHELDLPDCDFLFEYFSRQNTFKNSAVLL